MSEQRLLTQVFFGLLLGTGSLCLHAQQVSPAPYQPHQLKPIVDQTYQNRDGSINIVGDADMAPLVAKLNELFIKTHPGLKITLSMKGASTGIPGLTAGISAIAPMARENWPVEIEPFKRLYGYLPSDIHIGRAGYKGPGRKNPPGLYVHADNPLLSLSVDQVVRIFSTGNGHGDITRWEQLEVQGKWGKRNIHLYGPRDDGGFGSTLRATLMGDQPFAPHYEAVDGYDQVIEAVADDPFGIGLVDYFAPDKFPQGVRLLALTYKAGGAGSTAERREVEQGLYPLSNYLHLYFNRTPGKPVDPFVLEYARLSLSSEGQAIIASFSNTEAGCSPLTAAEIPAELAKLQ